MVTNYPVKLTTAVDVPGLGAAAKVDLFVLDPVTFVEVTVSFGIDGRIVYKHFLATFGGLDKTVSLDTIKPFHLTGFAGHINYLHSN